LFHFKESANLDNQNHETFYNIGILYENREERDVAYSYFMKALQLSPDFSLVKEKLENYKNVK
jgi:tetratricopeptide (TPR) repeat protein